MNQAHPSKRPSAAALVAVRELQEILDTQAEGYRRLLATIERQREAIRTADIAAVPDIAGVQEKIVQRLKVLDDRREIAGATVATALGIDADSTISIIASVLPSGTADRLEVRAAELRQLVEQARREQSLVRNAGEALARHMAGIVQSVTGALSGTGVYGRRGRLREGSPLVAGVDLTS
ncbi:MAG: hypothetical protein CMJ51_03340 [Planctomycetaceae bacterium]|nr:hypothetical protein [Planctomycetaceae bacterium]